MRLMCFAFLALGACSVPQAAPQAVAPAAALSEAAPQAPVTPTGPPPPTGARIEPSGFATILSAPPLPYPDAPPAPPREQESQRIAREQGTSVSRAERMMNPDSATMQAAMALHRRLQRDAPGNYVDVQIVRDPRARYQFHFRRNGPETLARFTRDARFQAVTGGVPAAELQPIVDEWLRRLTPLRLATGGGADPFRGVARIDLGVSRSEFETIAAREGWQVPASVELSFAPEIDPARVVAPDAAPFVRTFPRADRSPGAILSIAKGGRIILVDGCFRLNTTDGPFVLFGRDTRMVRDADGYLAVASSNNLERGGRIGEHMTWGGYPGPVEGEPGMEAIRQHCGAGPIEAVGVPQSTAWFRVRPHAIAAYAEVRQLSLQAAWDEIKACWAEEDARFGRVRPGQMPSEPMRQCDSPHGTNPPPPRRPQR